MDGGRGGQNRLFQATVFLFTLLHLASGSWLHIVSGMEMLTAYFTLLFSDGNTTFFGGTLALQFSLFCRFFGEEAG